MLAARITGYGDSSVFRVEDAPEPHVGPRDVLVRVRAAGVNPVDAKIRGGAQRAVMRPPMPAILGMDLAGDVVRVGAQVTDFAPGDKVFASPSHRRMGAYAELASVDVSELARMPASLSYVEAASLPLAALTAWDALVRRGHLERGQRVLVQAGAGGVGTLAIQLAKHLGAEVYATASAKNLELLAELGADHPIDYNAERYEEVARGCDLVVDCLGPEHFDRALETVRPGGRVIALTTGLPEAVAQRGPWLGTLAVGLKLARYALVSRVRKGVRFIPMARKSDGAALAEIAALVEAGAVRPVVDSVFPLREVARAHDRIEAGRSRGKLVLSLAA